MNKDYKYLIIGSGPGGTVAAKTLIEHGETDICIIEEGKKPIKNTKMGSFKDLTENYRNGGAEIIFSKPKVSIAHGKVLGGGSEVNSGLYHRINKEQLQSWANTFDIKNLNYEELLEHYSSNEEWLNVNNIDNKLGTLSKKIIDGFENTKYETENVSRWQKLENNEIISQSMFEVFHKNNIVDTFVDARAERIIFENKKAKHALISYNKKTIKISFKYLIIACGTFQTPKLLLNSGYNFNNKLTFEFHPHMKIGIKFNEKINSTEIVSPIQVKFNDLNSSFGSSINTPQWKALFLMDKIKNNSKNVVSSLENWGIYYLMIKPEGTGSIIYSKFLKSFFLSFKFTQTDINNFSDSVSLIQKIYKNLDIHDIALPTKFSENIVSKNHFDEANFIKYFMTMSLHSVHTFSTLRIGETNKSELDSYGVLKHINNVLICDSSVLPKAPGKNPQGIIMALTRRNIINFIENAK